MILPENLLKWMVKQELEIHHKEQQSGKESSAQSHTTSSGLLYAGVGSESIAPGWKTVLPYGKKTETDIFYNRDIYVKALVFRVGELEAAFVEADVIGVVFEEAQRIKARITQESGIPMENIILGAVHNHSYPRLKGPDVLDFVAEQCARAVKNARGGMFPAMIGSMKRTMPENLSINRSWACGQVNSDLYVIRIDDSAGFTRAVLFNCGIHPTCFTTSWGDDKTGMIGPEWPEYVRRQVSFHLRSHYDYDRHNAGMPHTDIFTMFTLGAAGDQQASLWLDETDGHKMPVLRAFVGTIAGEVLNMVDWIITKPTVEMAFRWKRLWMDMLSRDYVRGERETLVQLLSINDTALISIPGELTYNLGQELVHISPYKFTIPVTCANDYLPGYIVSEGESREAVTYESKDWCHQPELGTIIIDAAASLLNQNQRPLSAAGEPKNPEFGSIGGVLSCKSKYRLVAGVMNKIEQPSPNPPFWGKRTEVGQDERFFIDRLLPGTKYLYVIEVSDDYSGQANQDKTTIFYGMPVQVLPGKMTEVDLEFPSGLYHTGLKSIGIETVSVGVKNRITGQVYTAGYLREDESLEARLYYAGTARYLSVSGSLRKTAYPDDVIATGMVDREGRFEFNHVAPGAYVVGCWLDVNKNSLVEPGVDIISPFSKPVIVE
ncbi:MAG: hypothetical protein FIA99_12765 [Ruminiclostridium sp.]|nr:hypothetical protein [Ruminiclostridium sp.]